MLLAEFKTSIKKQVKMKELGPIAHYLKIRIVLRRPNKHIYLLQETYAKRF